MVIGPDGKPCRACSSASAFRAWGSGASKAKAKATAATAAAVPAAVTAGGAGDSASKECPADVEQLGRATWTFLHTAAAYYPDNPTPAHRTHMANLLSALPTLYPCGVCADHLKDEVKKFPPDVSGRAGLSRWLCERHNEVNGRLGKDKFNCSLSSLDERWKDGPPGGDC